MPHPVKKIYEPGTPGDARKKAGLTLSEMQKQLKRCESSQARTALRRAYRADGRLG